MLFNRNHNLKICRAPLKRQAQGTSLFMSTEESKGLSVVSSNLISIGSEETEYMLM